MKSVFTGEARAHTGRIIPENSARAVFVYLCICAASFPVWGPCAPFPVPSARPGGSPVVPFPSPANISLLKPVCHHKPQCWSCFPSQSMPTASHELGDLVPCWVWLQTPNSFPLALPFPAFPTSQPFRGSFALHKGFFSGAVPDTSLVLVALPAAASTD